MTALLKTATVAIAVLLATPLTVLAQPDLPRSPETASLSQPLNRQSPEVRELEKLGEQLGRDLRAEIDTEALRRTLEPVARQSLRTFLDAAPDLSRSLVKLSEWYLKDLGDRAQRSLDRTRQESTSERHR